MSAAGSTPTLSRQGGPFHRAPPDSLAGRTLKGVRATPQQSPPGATPQRSACATARPMIDTHAVSANGREGAPHTDMGGDDDSGIRRRLGACGDDSGMRRRLGACGDDSGHAATTRACDDDSGHATTTRASDDDSGMRRRLGACGDNSGMRRRLGHATVAVASRREKIESCLGDGPEACAASAPAARCLTRSG
jgi:hypothetical protein